MSIGNIAQRVTLAFREHDWIVDVATSDVCAQRGIFLHFVDGTIKAMTPQIIPNESGRIACGETSYICEKPYHISCESICKCECNNNAGNMFGWTCGLMWTLPVEHYYSITSESNNSLVSGCNTSCWRWRRVYTSNANLRRIRRPFCALGARFLGHQCWSTP